ncbi:FtsK/SpoIIIE domain-containing protein [Chloroflexota bacterium]
METSLLNLPALKREDRRGMFPGYGESSLTERRIQPKRATTPSLYRILDTYGAFPPYSLVIGLSKDGLPFMLDLDNPKSGSILVVGETGSGKTQLLNVVSTSACLLNNPQNVSLHVISKKANEYTGLFNFPHCQTLLNPYDRAAGEMVIELASIAEQRRTGRELGSMRMLIIDDFSSISRMLSDYSVYLNLKTLVSRGPKSGIWPIISINPNDVHEEIGHLLRSFGTYIFERSTNQTQFAPAHNQAIDSGDEFTASFDVIIGGRLNPIITLSL